MQNEQTPSPLSRNTVIFRYWLPPLFYAGFIFILSSLPGKAYLPQFFSADKVYHMVEYGILGFLVARAFGAYGISRRILFIRTLSLCVIFAVSDELHQFFVPRRVTSLMDIAADGLGAFLGTVLYSKWRKHND